MSCHAAENGTDESQENIFEEGGNFCGKFCAAIPAGVAADFSKNPSKVFINMEIKFRQKRNWWPITVSTG